MIQKFDDCHCLCSTKIDRAPGTRERVIRCERSGSRRRWSWCWPWALGLLVGSSIDVQGLVGSKAKPAIKRATRAADRTIFFTMVSPSEGGVCHEWIVEIGAIILQVSAVQTIGDVAGNPTVAVIGNNSDGTARNSLNCVQLFKPCRLGRQSSSGNNGWN